MNTTRFYQVGLLALLVLNLGLLAFLFWRVPPGPPAGHPLPPPPRMEERAVELMDLDQTQSQAFDRLRKAHHEELLDLRQQQAASLQAYFSGLNSDAAAASADSSLQAALDLEAQKVRATYAHFSEVKALLRPEQAAGFATFIEEALDRILHGPGGPPRQQGPHGRRPHPPKGGRP